MPIVNKNTTGINSFCAILHKDRLLIYYIFTILSHLLSGIVYNIYPAHKKFLLLGLALYKLCSRNDRQPRLNILL